MVGERVDSPWLGERRGYLVDWLTQRWVQFTGKRLDLSVHPWLTGPTGTSRGIGPDFFERFAESQNLAILPPDPDAGLMTSFEALAGPEFSPNSVSPQVREFDERTARLMPSRFEPLVVLCGSPSFSHVQRIAL